MNILNAIRKYILAVRPAYKDYLGKKTEEITIADIVIGEDYAHVDEQEGGGVTYSYEIPNTPITYFQPGEKYNVIIDGDKKEYMAFVGGDVPLLASNNTMQEIADNPEGWACGFIEKGNLYFMIINKASFPYNGKRFTITQTTTEEKWDIKKLPEECVPDSITKTVKRNKQKIATLEGDVDNVNTHADSAYSLANSAKNAATTAQNTANAAKTAAATAQSTADTAKTNAATAQTAADAAQKAADGITPNWDENNDTSRKFIRGRTHFTGSSGNYTVSKYSKAITDEKIIWNGATEDIRRWSINPEGLYSNYNGIKITYVGTDYTVGKNAYAYRMGGNLVLIYRKVQELPIFLGAIVDVSDSTISSYGEQKIEGVSVKVDRVRRGLYAISGVDGIYVPAYTKQLDEKYIPNTIQRTSTAATKDDPVFTGSFSQNRKAGTTVGIRSHAEGYNTTASGGNSHAEGYNTIANGTDTHAEGSSTTASGESSHAEGRGTVAFGDAQHVQGKYNILSETDYISIVGNGSSANARHNAHTLTYGGIPWYQGRPQFGGNAMNDGAQTVMANDDEEIIMKSPTKKFKITVDDTGVMSTTNADDASQSKTFAIDEDVAKIKPDWGENDTSNKAYIANRTHYEIAPVTYNRGGYTVYNSIIYVDTATESDMCKWTSPDLLGLLDSFEGLSFSFLGTDYTIGENAYAVAANTSNDCFLLYTTIQGNYWTLGAICKAEQGSSISLTFSKQIEGKTIKFKNMTRGFYLYQTITSVKTPGAIKCLDEKYVPNTIQRVGEDIILNSSTSGSTKKFKITVDDSGAISATEVTS